jgi:hypothetical protein
MNKLVALALAACLFSAVSAQNSTTTTNSTVKTNTTTTNTTTVVLGNGTTGSWCRANTDCIQTQGFCCSSTSTGILGYIQFNCNKHTNGTATVGTCINNATNDYNVNCAGQGKICISNNSKATYCGGSVAMKVIDVLPNVSCVSSAYTMMISMAFFAMVALTYVL